jgi:tripartite-type tricarboxylate transporter receptor subunit TctC
MTTQRTGPALSRRTLLGAAAALAGWTAAGAQPSAGAQAYPKAPIRVVVPYPPGGPTDVVGRVVTARLGEALGQPLVVDNKAGASGMVGAALVAKARPMATPCWSTPPSTSSTPMSMPARPTTPSAISSRSRSWSMCPWCWSWAAACP